MDFEGSISSWIGKIHEGFETFYLEAKDILPKKLVESVQDQLVTAAENLKQFCFDLNMSSEMEENVVLHYENYSVDEEDVIKCVEVVEVESSLQFSTSVEVGSSAEAYVTSDFEFTPEWSESEWYIPPDPTKLIVERLNLEELVHSRWIASYRFCLDDSHDDDLRTSTHKSSGKNESDLRFKIKKPDYSHLLGHDLRAELIKQGFLSPLSGSVQSIVSESSEETQEIDGSLDDQVTSSVDTTCVRTPKETEKIDGSSDDKVICYVDDAISSRISDVMFHNELQSRVSDISFLNSDCDTDSIPDMSECRSNPKQSPLCDAIYIVAKSNKDNAEIVQDNEWERLDDVDGSDEDWEIV